MTVCIVVSGNQNVSSDHVMLGHTDVYVIEKGLKMATLETSQYLEFLKI